MNVMQLTMDVPGLASDYVNECVQNGLSQVCETLPKAGRAKFRNESCIECNCANGNE